MSNTTLSIVPDLASPDRFRRTADGKILVTPDNFIRAESDVYMAAQVRDGAFGRIKHTREPAPVDREWLAGSSWILGIGLRKGARSIENTDEAGREWRFGAAGDRDVKSTRRDGACGLGNRDARGRAGRGVGEHGAADAMPDRDVGCSGIAHDGHRGERTRRLGTVVEQLLVPGLGGAHAAIDVAIVHACAHAQFGEVAQPCVLDRLVGGKDRHLLATIEKRPFQRLEQLGEVPVNDAGSE